MLDTTSISISYENIQLKDLAESIASKLDLPILHIEHIDTKNPLPSTISYCLHFAENGLSLIANGNNNHGAIKCDFVAGSNHHRRNYGGGNGQMIAKAVGVSGKFHPEVVDLTAGLGADSFVLAGLGCNITMTERNPIVHLLLQDGLSRAMAYGYEQDPLLSEIIGRMLLKEIDGLSYLKFLRDNEFPDVIYLDPMFPLRKKSAKVKKEMQALHCVVGDNDDATLLLDSALSKARYRVVIKRPSHAEYLGNKKPSYSLEGKSTRFDIFALQKLPA
jgi:16S rRNA (guanine1516-N2)-methyltransferase